mmetsp:Transcript_54891/g.129714  ORF Transcript_54891/g.129714 Transcript_54891/m.129714 type:complete len:322 (+) Transcript_54891:302-1267(+)
MGRRGWDWMSGTICPCTSAACSRKRGPNTLARMQRRSLGGARTLWGVIIGLFKIAGARTGARAALCALHGGRTRAISSRTGSTLPQWISTQSVRRQSVSTATTPRRATASAIGGGKATRARRVRSSAAPWGRSTPPTGRARAPARPASRALRVKRAFGSPSQSSARAAVCRHGRIGRIATSPTKEASSSCIPRGPSRLPPPPGGLPTASAPRTTCAARRRRTRPALRQARWTSTTCRAPTRATTRCGTWPTAASTSSVHRVALRRLWRQGRWWWAPPAAMHRSSRPRLSPPTKSSRDRRTPSTSAPRHLCARLLGSSSWLW